VCTSAQKTTILHLHLLASPHPQRRNTHARTLHDYPSAFAVSVMETQKSSASDGPHPTSSTTTNVLAGQHQLRQFNETQPSSTSPVSPESSQAAGIAGYTNAAGRGPVRLFETEDEDGQVEEEDERGLVVFGDFEVDVSIYLYTLGSLSLVPDCYCFVLTYCRTLFSYSDAVVQENTFVHTIATF